MALDKLVDSTQLDADLTSIASAIRTKGGTSAQLAFPSEFVSAIEAIETGGGSDPMHLATGVDFCIVLGSALFVSDKMCNDIGSTTPNTRRSLFTLDGNSEVSYREQNTFTQSDLHLILIPDNATKLTLTVDRTMQFAATAYSVSSSGAVSDGVAIIAGWNDITANTGFEMDIPTGVNALSAMFRVNSSNSSFTYSTTPRMVKIDFS